MKRLIVLLVCFSLAVSLSGCRNIDDNNQTSDNLSTTKYNETTNKYYEETDNGYKATYYEKDEITPTAVAEWLSQCSSGEYYHEYIYTDPESWDLFIYYSPDKDEFNFEDFKFSVTDSVVKIYATTNSSTQDAKKDYLLIRIQAPQRGPWPSASKLFVDDISITQT
ncbi:MAG: hypothetical protein FWG24_06700 [Eggerthellaceae bacterium]|jgi:uncharacterized protein YceK|nr:hypothetical protein [Eggerthellaceae bacterium]MDR2721282.1 hypothetical protein [Coriobacteriaceae bacterium]